MTLRILLAESDAEDTLFLQDVLTELEGREYWSDWVHLEILHAASWEEAEAILRESSTTEGGPAEGNPKPSTATPGSPAPGTAVDVLLLDLNLYTSVREAIRAPRGMPAGGVAPRAEIFRRAKSAAPHVPVVLLAEPQDIPLAEFLVREGAQDFMVKSQVDCVPLAHALRNAMERHRYLESARATAMTDPLTGLLNRAVFLALAERDRKLALGTHRRILLAVGEASGVANENTAGDPLSKDQGADLALVKIAEQLLAVSGPTDLVARIGGRRFGIAVHETEQQSWEEAWDRLKTASTGMPLTIGAAVFDPNLPATLEDLLEEAERELAPVAVAARR